MFLRRNNDGDRDKAIGVVTKVCCCFLFIIVSCLLFFVVCKEINAERHKSSHLAVFCQCVG